MPKRKPGRPSSHRGPGTTGTPGILELERFSEETLTRWKAASEDLDELWAVLYFGVQPEQRRLRPALIEALQRTPASAHSFSCWARIITYQYSMNPLSAAGSVLGLGGRFNAGADLDPKTLIPWPALYIAEDHETALREKFQMSSNETVEGLTPQELALTHSVSYSKIALNVELRNVFDMTSPKALDVVAKTFGRIKMPIQARALMKKLRIRSDSLRMISTGQHLYNAVLTQNWRTLPVQFGLPAHGQILAELIREARFEAILYRSTKGPGRCLAVFPDLLTSGSFVELADAAPQGVQHKRLDMESGDDLSGWDWLPPQKRPR